MPFYTRVKDKDTGHEFDVPETDPRIGNELKPVKPERYPRARNPRPPKHNVSSEGSPAEEEAPDAAPAPGGQAEASADGTDSPEPRAARGKQRK